jgi:thioredoxin
MKLPLFFWLILLLAGFSSCSSGQQSSALLAPRAFSEQLTAAKDAQLLDVRTAQEFAEGAIEGAVNVDWTGNSFEAGIAGLDKKKPLFVYCLSGGRSASATEFLRKSGFEKVYELAGGILAWKRESLPLTALAPKPKGMTRKEFDAKIAGSGLPVLVDFYAEWCGPCKKMKPDLDWLHQVHGTKVWVWRLDADLHSDLSTDLGINGLPTLIVYRNKKEALRKEGFQSRKDLLQMVGL